MTHRSYTAASRELLVGQPALTRTVQQLEAALGVRLLERTSRSVQLTAAGQDFLDQVRGVLADLDRAILAARGQQELRLGFQWVLPEPWATASITGFEQATGATVTLLRRDDVDSDLARGDRDRLHGAHIEEGHQPEEADHARPRRSGVEGRTER